MTDRTDQNEATPASGFGSWPPRYDPSSVGPYGSYTAKRCPARIQWDIVRPAEPLTVVPIDLQLRFDMGNDYEAEMVAELRRLASGARWVFVDDHDDQLARTVRAVADGATVIVGGRLPPDETGRRIGDPDLLVAHPEGGYLPVDIKHHLTVREKRPEKRQRDAVISDLDDLEAMVLTSLADSTQRLHEGDALQLAHYRRMLQSTGWAAPEGLAGIIGKEGYVTWYDLDFPLFQTPAKTERKRAKRTAMERYDFEFGFRLDIATVANRVVGGSDEELIVEPMACSECATCPWHDHCMGIMQSEGDLSLVTGTDYSYWRPLRDGGIRTAQQLGQLDPHTASAMSSLDVPGLLRRVNDLPAETPMDQVISARATTQLADAARHGLVTVADLRSLHTPTIETGMERSFFPQIIERARAFAGDADVYLHPRGVDDPVPRADVEIDIDMENGSDERVYLWGALLNRDGRSEYVPFVSWDVLDESAERDLFTRFWRWFTSIRTETISAGGTFRAYCWYAGAENKRLQDLSTHAVELADEVAAFIDSPEWVDLYAEFAKRYLTGRSLSLKVVAPLAGFNWDAPDAGGGPSMVYHLDAVDTTSPTRADSKQWLLTYNRNDVEATARIREWVDQELQAPPLPK